MKTNTVEKEANYAKNQAQSQIKSIVEMVALLGKLGETDGACDAIRDCALSVEVRSDWHTPCDNNTINPVEYKILLCTGGPAVQITGVLSQYGDPETAIVQFQDWGTPWTDYRETTSEQDAAILTYAQQFYFGE